MLSAGNYYIFEFFKNSCNKRPCKSINLSERERKMTVLNFSVQNGTVSAAELDSMLSAVARGDTKAFEMLYNATRVSVYSFALSIVKNSYDAEDVMQDCYVALFASAADYVSCGKPLAWILTIVRNLCFQKFRTQKLNSEFHRQDKNELSAEKTAVSPDDRLILKECLEKLQDQERQIIILHAVSGFKHREIAEFLEIPLPTVLSKYHRALKKLRKYLQ